jgi:Uncharacterized protein conserved in bacteria (DUF2188)
MIDDQLYVERNSEGDYTVRKARSKEPLAVCPTQAEAIKKAKKLNPDKKPHIERVRNTPKGTRDKWRK